MKRVWLRQVFVLLALALVPALISGAVQLRWQGRPAPSAGDQKELAEVQRLGKPIQWVDARPRSRFEQGHIPGAVLLNEDEWDQLVPTFLDAWQPDQPIVVYCDSESCDASEAIARRLREELKLEPVWVLKGGWSAWAKR